MKDLEVKGARLWIGRILFWLSAAFMLMDVIMHLARPPFVLEASAKAGIDAALLLPIGVYELVAIVLLITPRFRALGAVMYTAFLGGATASHLLVSKSPFVFPVITAVLLWVGVVCLSPKTGAALGLEDGLR